MEEITSFNDCSLSPKSFAMFAEFITRELGIKMVDAKLPMVQGRILRRVRELQLGSLERYRDYFFSSCNGEEREQFINVITTNKTDFFREPEHFDYLIREALPRLIPASGLPGDKLNLWSAGCSTGEEPYTIAMVVSEYAAQGTGIDFAILGTDVSTKVLADAQRGIYQEAQVEPVPVALRNKYLLRSKASADCLVRVVPQLRRKISFHQLNFMDHNYELKDTYDVIFLRNVLIYFDKSTQETVIHRVCKSLVPGGYLFVGHSESLAALDVPVACVRTSIFRKPLERASR